jgi:ubiquitin carboxyl-terminal hydrolase L5
MAWNTIESDPAVFTELLEAAGARGLQLEELYTMDDVPTDTYGLFFLFKWKKGRARDPPTECGADAPIFLQQVIPNACGTIALLHVLLNCPGLDIGEVLTNFREFVRFLPAEDRGTALGKHGHDFRSFANVRVLNLHESLCRCSEL